MLLPTSSSARRAPLSTRHMVRAPARSFYESTLRALSAARVPFVVGGAFALKHYAGVARDTKDLDVFVRQQDLEAALAAVERRGFEARVVFSHWLAKAYCGESFVDFIFNSANGLCPVDDAWLEHAPQCTLWGIPVLLCPIEEMIWTKCFVMERERFDGADVNHLIEAMGEAIDWKRLLERFGDDWRVLLGHIVFYTYVFPRKRNAVPDYVVDTLTARLERERPPETSRVCRGTSLSREQYLVDLRERGYEDSRAPPWGPLSADDLAAWTDAIGTDV